MRWHNLYLCEHYQMLVKGQLQELVFLHPHQRLMKAIQKVFGSQSPHRQKGLRKGNGPMISANHGSHPLV